jgi:hypothetical protein
MQVPKTFWSKRRLPISCLLSTPALVSIIFWGTIFDHPGLAFVDALIPLFFVVIILSFVGVLASILHFAVTRKSWDVITCLSVNIVNIPLCLYGCLWCFSAGLNAW